MQYYRGAEELVVDPKLQKKLQPFNTIEDFKVERMSVNAHFLYFSRCFTHLMSLVPMEKGVVILARGLDMEGLGLK